MCSSDLGTDWVHHTLGAGYRAALAIDGDGRVHVVASNGPLEYYRRDAQGWHHAQLDDTVGAGFWGNPALALDDDDRLHVAYPVGTPHANPVARYVTLDVTP